MLGVFCARKNFKKKKRMDSRMKKIQFVLWFVFLAVSMMPAPVFAQDDLPPKLCLEDLLGMAVELAKAGVQVEFLDINNIWLTVDQLQDTTKIVSVYFNGVSGKHLGIIQDYAEMPMTMARTNSWLKSMTKYAGKGGFGFYLPDFHRCFPPSGPQTQTVPAWDPGNLPSWLRDQNMGKKPWAGIDFLSTGLIMIFVIFISGILFLSSQKRFA